MQLVDVEHLFGGERIVIYYLAENRVDFRELVRVLAGEFQTRIEMRQIGVRDEAKLLADYGDCGCAGLLQHAPGADAAGVDADGQAAKGHARSDEDFGPLRAAEVLPPLRVRNLRARAARAAAGTARRGPGQQRRHGNPRPPPSTPNPRSRTPNVRSLTSDIQLLGWQLYCRPRKLRHEAGWQCNCHPNNDALTS